MRKESIAEDYYPVLWPWWVKVLSPFVLIYVLVTWPIKNFFRKRGIIKDFYYLNNKKFSGSLSNEEREVLYQTLYLKRMQWEKKHPLLANLQRKFYEGTGAIMY